MPSPTQISDGLARIANDAIVVAIVWHAIFLVAVFSLLLGWRPTGRLAGELLTLPLFSVGVLA